MARTHQGLDRRVARRAAVVVWSAVISLLIGTSAMPSEAAPGAAEYVPELCLTFSDPSPGPGDQLAIDGCAEPGAAVSVSIGGEAIGSTTVTAAGTFRTTVTIPDLEPGSYPLVVVAGGIELGSLDIVVGSPVGAAAQDSVWEDPVTVDPRQSDSPAEDDSPAEGDSPTEGDSDGTPPEQLALSEDEGLAAFWSNVRRFLMVIGAVAIVFGMISSFEANRGRRGQR